MKREHLTDNNSSHDITNAQAGSRGRIRTQVWFVSSALTLDYPPAQAPSFSQPRQGEIPAHPRLGAVRWEANLCPLALEPIINAWGWGKRAPPPRFQVERCRNHGRAPGTPSRAQARCGYPGGLLRDSSQTEACFLVALRGRDLLNAPAWGCSCPETPSVLRSSSPSPCR